MNPSAEGKVSGGVPPHIGGLTYASLVFVALLCMLPFQIYAHSFWREWVGGTVGLMALVFFLSKQTWKTPEFPVVALAPLALVLVILVQIATGLLMQPERGQMAALHLLWAALLVWLGHALMRAHGREWLSLRVAAFVLAGGAVAGLTALMQYLNITAPPWIGPRTGASISGNLLQTNQFADYEAMAFASLVFLSVSGRMRLRWAVPLAGLLLFGMAVSGSRSSWLYLAALVLLALVVWHRQRDAAPSRALLKWALWAVPVFVLMQFAANLFAVHVLSHDPLATPYERITNSPGGIEVRWLVVRNAWDIFLESPLLGVGIGQFVWAHFLKVAENPLPELQNVLFGHTHNLVTQLLAEMGIAALLVVVLAAFAWLWGYRRREWSPADWWCLALLAIMGIHSLLEFPLWYTYFLGIAAILLGMGETRSFSLSINRTGRMVFATAIALGGITQITLLRDQMELDRVHNTLVNAQALKQNFRDTMARLSRVQHESLLKYQAEHTLAVIFDLNREQIGSKLAVSVSAMLYAPGAQVTYRHAMLLALAGDTEGAKKQFAVAMRVHPAKLAWARHELETLAIKDPATFNPLLVLAGKTAQRWE